MKVGDYVRTPYGIRKVKSIAKHDKYQDDGFYVEDRFIVCGKEAMKKIKSSPNKIDLIEENDLIKIEEQKGIYTICEVEKFKEPYTNYEFLGVRLENRPIARKLHELNIKQIWTKEQFEDNGYTV